MRIKKATLLLSCFARSFADVWNRRGRISQDFGDRRSQNTPTSRRCTLVPKNQQLEMLERVPAAMNVVEPKKASKPVQAVQSLSPAWRRNVFSKSKKENNVYVWAGYGLNGVSLNKWTRHPTEDWIYGTRSEENMDSMDVDSLAPCA
uniref:C-type lectin domain-containing protein n=1 Tax=Steinernema glaseri TaxID=37863 RepID=A0A1I7ZKY4_9BILA